MAAVVPFPNLRVSSGLRNQQGLDGAALVHGAVAVGRLLQRERLAEDFAGVDLAAEHQADQLRHVAAHRCGAAVQPDVREEQRMQLAEALRAGSAPLTLVSFDGDDSHPRTISRSRSSEQRERISCRNGVSCRGVVAPGAIRVTAPGHLVWARLLLPGAGCSGYGGSAGWPNTGLAAFVFTHLDLTTFRNSTGGQRNPGDRFFSDLGIHPTQRSDSVATHDGEEWRYTVRVLARRDFNGDGAEEVAICFTDQAQNGGS
jgi:hypothetical protein